ncbi:MAG: RNA polymerase sigma factor [Granulosicoccaceae bacterium]
MSSSDPALEALLQTAYRYAHALCGHAEMAEDLVHEGWLKVVAKHGHKPDKALLFRVVRNLFIDDVRHKTRFPSDSFDEQLLSDATGFEPSHYASYDLVLAQGLAELRRVDREILFLWVFEGYTAAEIAELTDQSRGTVLSQIHRAKGKLKNYLELHGSKKLTVVKRTGKQSL